MELRSHQRSFRSHLERLKKRASKKQIRRRFNGSCSYCGARPNFLTIDHIISKHQGRGLGLPQWWIEAKWNKVPACKDCNQSKGHRFIWDWWQQEEFWDVGRAKRVERIMDEGEKMLRKYRQA